MTCDMCIKESRMKPSHGRMTSGVPMIPQAAAAKASKRRRRVTKNTKTGTMEASMGLLRVRVVSKENTSRPVQLFHM